MDEVLSILSAAPIVLAVIAFITSLLGVRGRAKADAEFVNELSKSISHMKATIERQKAELEINRAEMERVQAKIDSELKTVELKQGGDTIHRVSFESGSSGMYHIYFSGVKGRGENKELPSYVKEALHNLDKRDKKHIVKALNQPSVKGRMRYFDKVFKMASQLI